MLMVQTSSFRPGRNATVVVVRAKSRVMETDGFNGTRRLPRPFPTPQYFTKAMLLPAFAVAFIAWLPRGQDWTMPGKGIYVLMGRGKGTGRGQGARDRVREQCTRRRLRVAEHAGKSTRAAHAWG